MAIIVEINRLEMSTMHVRILQLEGASVFLISIFPSCCNVYVFANGCSDSVLWLGFKAILLILTEPQNGGRCPFVSYCFS